MNKLILHFLKYYLLFFVATIFFFNPIFPKGYFIGDRSLIAIMLAPWWLISFYLVLQLNIKKKNNLFFTIGIIVSYFYFLLSLAIEDRSSDILRLSYTIAFISILMMLYKINPTRNEIKKWSSFVDIAGFSLVTYSFLTSYGFIPFPFEYQISIGEQRFTFDSTVGSISFLGLWFAYRLLGAKTIGLYILSSSAIILGLLRILASSTRGILVGTIVGLLIMLVLNINIKNIKKIIAYMVSAFMVSAILLFISGKNEYIEKGLSVATAYTTLIEGRGGETGESRVVEAFADFDTFAEYPLLGAGFQIAGLKKDSLGGSSSGHFFLTGTLARFGMLGLLGFGVIYILAFRSISNICLSVECKKKLYPFYVLIVFFLIFGNPLYLLPQWPGIVFILYILANLERERDAFNSNLL